MAHISMVFSKRHPPGKNRPMFIVSWKKKLQQVAPGNTLDPVMRHWLCEPGSLTKRLQKQGEFHLQRHLQKRQYLAATETAPGANIQRQLCWVREVTLYLDKTPLIFARSLLATHPRGPLHRSLTQLGESSLGALLFRHPGFQRGPMYYTQLKPGQGLHTAAINRLGYPDQALYARCCPHQLYGQTVWVAEVFSPAVINLRQANDPQKNRLEPVNLSP